MVEMSEKTYKFLYERNASASYLMIEADCSENVVGYQIEMIANNPNTSVLPLYVRRTDNALRVYYDITSKVSLSWLLKRKKLRKNEFIGILCGIAKPLLEAGGYLLKESCFIINENYIFVSPDLTEISLAYLPIPPDSDYLKSYKEIVLKLVTELADIEESPADDYLQRILKNIKQENFNICNFDKLLKEVSFNYFEEEKVSEQKYILTNNAENESLLIPPSKISRHSTKEQKINTLAGKSSVVNRRTIAISLLQAILVLILLVLYKSQILNSTNEADTTSTYVGLLLVAGAIDFLVVRGILSMKGKCADTNDEAKKLSNKPLKQSYRGDHALAEKLSDTSSSNCQTEFLCEKKDSSPYLQGGKDGLYEKIPIKKSQFIIGRLKEQVDFTCNNNAVGKIHAEVTIKDGLYYIKDLNSRNGTFVNNQRIESNIECEIKNNDKISLANSDYVFVVPHFSKCTAKTTQ